MSASSPRPTVDGPPAAAPSDPAYLPPRDPQDLAMQLRLSTSQPPFQDFSPCESVSPLDEADVNSHLSRRPDGNASHHPATQLEPVSPLADSRRNSIAEADGKMQDSNVRESTGSGLDQKAAAAGPSTAAPAETPTSPSTAQFASNSVHPAPAYVAESSAVQVVTEHQASKRQASGENGDLQPDLSFSPGALALINAFLDYILYGCLANARATSLAALRPAVTEVLKQRLAKDAIASAEEELQELLVGNEEEEDVNDVEDTGEWDLNLVWKRTRLRVMVYIRLGEMEDEDEERFVDEEDLLHGSDRSFSRSSGLVSWAAAIFLTSVLEYLAEQSLQTAGQAAFSRALRPTRPNTASSDPQVPTAVVVEDHDAEKIALSASLGRIWRTWRKSLRSGGSSRSGIRHPGSRSGAMTPASVADSSVDTRDRSFSTATHRSDDKYVEAQEESGPVDPANIPLPMSDERRDVDEIEVPGLSADPDAVAQPEEVATKRRQSFVLPPTRRIAPADDTIQPLLVRQRSTSLPTPVRPAVLSGIVPGAFPTDGEIEASGAEADATADANNVAKAAAIVSEAENPVTELGADQIDMNTPEAGTAAAKVAFPAATLGNAERIEQKEVQADAQGATQVNVTPENQVGSVVKDASDHLPSAKLQDNQCANKPMSTQSLDKDVASTSMTVRQTKTLAGSDRPASIVADVTAVGASGAALSAAVAAYSPKSAQSSDTATKPAPTVPLKNDEQVEKMKSLASMKMPSPGSDASRRSEPPVAAAKVSVQGTKEADRNEQNADIVPQSAVPRHLDSSSRNGPEKPHSKGATIPEFPMPHSRSGSEHSQTSVTPDSQRQPRSQPDFIDVDVDVDANKALEKKIDSAHSAAPASHARGSQETRSAESSAPESALAASPTIPVWQLPPQSSSEKSRSETTIVSPPTDEVRSPAVDNEDLWKPPPQPSNTSVKTTVRILPPQVQQAQQPLVSIPRPRQKLTTPFSAPGVSRIPEAEVPRDSYFQPTPQSPKSPKSPRSPKPLSKAESDSSPTLTSAAIRAPEDFDAFVQNSETVKYTLTPDTVRDDSQKDRMLLRKYSPDPTDYGAKVSANGKALSPTLTTDTSMSRASVAKSSTSIVSPVEESPRSPRNLWPLNKDRRRSVARPEPQNVKAHEKSGLMAREPRVQTDSMRDFADFIRSTGPPKDAPAVPIPTDSPQAARSTTSLHTYRTGGSRTASRDSLPPPPGSASSRIKGSLQPRSPTVQPKASGELIDFIRSGPVHGGQHRIPRSVAPVRSTVDSDEFTEWADKPNTTPSIGSSRVEGQGFASQTSKVTSAPAVKSAFTDDSGRTRYRNKDPYAIDWSDEEDDRDTLIASLPPAQQDALTRILGGGSAPVASPTSVTRPMTNGSSTAPPVRSMSQSSRFSGVRNKIRAENTANTRDLISFLNAGPDPGIASSIKTKASLPSVREDYDSRPTSKQSKAKRGFLGFGRR